MQKVLILLSLLLVSSLSTGVSPSWTRDVQIDAGELKAVNFQIFIGNSTGAAVTNNQTVVRFLHFNKTNFNSTPRVIVALKCYGVLPLTNFTALNTGFSFNITSSNKTNLTYTVTTYGVTLIGLHYQYLAVLGYDNLYYMQFYTIYVNSSSALYDGSINGVRTDSFVKSNPGGYVTNANFSSSEMVLQAWPYYFLFTPSGSTLSFNVTAAATSTTSFTVTITADSGCGLIQVGISVLYLNKTAIFQNSYTQVVDISTQIITGSDLAGAIFTTTMDSIPLQYQFRNSQEGVFGVYLPFSPVNNPTVWYFSATSTNVSKLYYIAIQERYRVCPNTTSLFLVDDNLCYSVCPSPRYATNTTFKYCKKCHYSCVECSSADFSNACTLCNSTAYRNLSNSSCICNLTYFDNGTELCAPCHYTCLTCSNDIASACISCDTGLHRTITNSTCRCSYGFYENATCFACLNFCIQCSYSPTNETYRCLACNSSLFMQVDSGQLTCICKGGYYNNSNICSKCVDGCLICTNGITCDTCDSAKNWEKNITDNTCLCSNSSFLLIVNASKSCQACDFTCLTCSNNLTTSCTSCNSTINRVLSNATCICNNGFYQNTTCITCLNNCVLCSFQSNTQLYSCLSCNFSLFQVLDSGNTSCVCQVGYYDSNGTCIRCQMAGCIDCSDNSTCSNCNSSQHWHKNTNNTCICDDQYFMATVNSTNICAICDSNCLTCSNSNSECLSCNSTAHRNLTNFTCPCETGYYDNTTCFSCINRCIECSFVSANQTYICSKCNSTLFQQVDSTNMTCICQDGYYNNSGTCSACISGCIKCADGSTCITCDMIGKWQKNISDSTCNCMNSYYQVNSTTCLACQIGCISCFLNSSTLQCTQCNSSNHFILFNNTCICDTGFFLISSQCLFNVTSGICGNGIVNTGEECDDGNIDNFDGCSSLCKVQTNHFCLNNITNISVCYYSAAITFFNENIFKFPLQNKVKISLLVSAPNCNVTYLKLYLQNNTSIELVAANRRMLINSDIVSKDVQYDASTAIASITFQYNQHIDLTKKTVKFVASQSYSQASDKYFYASPQTVVGLSNPNNLLLTTYSSPDEIRTAKAISYAFAAMIGLMWLFWLISICYHQTASAVEFMLVAQIAYEALLQRRFITDGWIGLILYGKYCYGVNVEYNSPFIFNRLQVLSLSPYLFHTINISTAIIVLTVVLILGILCYETVKITQQENAQNLNHTEAKIEANSRSDQKNDDEQSQYKIKKGIALVLFEVGTSFTMLTVKIVVISLMVATAATAIDVAIVSSILAVCYFLVWYFKYRFYQFDFLDDFSFKRLLRDSQDTTRRKSFTAKVGNFFVKFYYLIVFLLLVGFGVVDGLPSFGAPFYILIIAASIIFLFGMIVFGVYFRSAHTVRAGCNLLALAGVMVLHLLESLQVDSPSQSLTGPIICLCILYTAFIINFGLMAYIQIRRHRNRKPKYRNSKVAPLEFIAKMNETEAPQLHYEEPLPILIRDGEEDAQQEVRKSDKSGESLVQDSKFQSLKSKSRDNSLSETHKKFAAPHPEQYQDTKQKNKDMNKQDQFIVIRQKMKNVEFQEGNNYEDRSEVERIEIVDMSRSVSDFAKTKSKLNVNDKPKNPDVLETNKKNIQFLDV